LSVNVFGWTASPSKIALPNPGEGKVNHSGAIKVDIGDTNPDAWMYLHRADYLPG
jgi:hypothetical protein